MCDGTPCPCNLGPDPALHRGRHVFYRGAPPPPAMVDGAGLRRWLAGWRCGWNFGHCWHIDPATSPLEPEFYCCECPRRQVLPGPTCTICGPFTFVVK